MDAETTKIWDSHKSLLSSVVTRFLCTHTLRTPRLEEWENVYNRLISEYATKEPEVSNLSTLLVKNKGKRRTIV